MFCGARQDQNLLTQENELFGVKRQHTDTAGTWSKASTTERGKVDRIQPSRPAAAAGSRYCKPPSASKNISPASLHQPTSLIGAGGSEQQNDSQRRRGQRARRRYLYLPEPSGAADGCLRTTNRALQTGAAYRPWSGTCRHLRVHGACRLLARMCCCWPGPRVRF